MFRLYQWGQAMRSDPATHRLVSVLHGPDPGSGFDCARPHGLCPALSEHPGHAGLVGETEPSRVSLVCQL